MLYSRNKMGFVDRIETIGDFFGFELCVLVTAKERRQRYFKDNSEKVKESAKNYRASKKWKTLYKNTEAYKKQIKHRWKYKGVIHDDFDALYDIYINCTNCMVCNKEFKNSRDKHLDHDHDTGSYRNVLCRSCNTKDYWKKVIQEQ